MDEAFGGEFSIARNVDSSLDRVCLHCNDKTPEELTEAVQQGIGHVGYSFYSLSAGHV